MTKGNMHSEQEETVLDFEVAKEMTVGEAAKKQAELEVGISEEDNLLDRYIKQHRQDIEAEKFETLMNQPAIQEPEQDLEETQVFAEELPIHKHADSPFVETVEEKAREAFSQDLPDPETAEFNDIEAEEKAEKRKKIWVWTALMSVFGGTVATAYLMLYPHQVSNTTPSTSSTTTTSMTASSSKVDTGLAAFETLYKTFFTDASMTKLKNSEFGKLAELKLVLDKMDQSSTDYKTAKAKYDALEKAIQAVQAMNGLFDKPLIVDGELDTTARVKDESPLVASATGIGSVDATLASAVTFGRSQQANQVAVASPAPIATQDQAGTSIIPSPVHSNSTTPVTTGSVVASDNPLYGIAIPAGVTLQRDLSRVPYDQSKIDDSANEAWMFNPGILENIIVVSQQRGYVVGNQYILEKVNIINGRGYYNLFKPDGTYLFSINCKTGYFVGNGSGYADDLDF